VRKEEKEEEHKPLFRTPFNDCSFLKKLSHKKPSEMEEPQT
jgi:hypothetical protein